MDTFACLWIAAQQISEVNPSIIKRNCRYRETANPPGKIIAKYEQEWSGRAVHSPGFWTF